MKNLSRSSLLLAVLLVFVGHQASLSQNFPTNNITIIVPYAAGGSADIVARLLGQKLQERLGRSVLVENRPGGSEVTATELLSRSEPDGHSIAILSNAIAINEVLVRDRRYDLARDIAPIARVIELPFAILVHPSVAADSIGDLVVLAKANPGKLNYGHLGPGSPHYFTMEWLKRTAGIDIVPVPYRGAAPAYAALIAGEVQVIASGLGAATPFLEAKQAKALAALSQKRPASLPDLPTISEAGYPNFDLRSWMGIFIRAGTPQNIVAQLESELMIAIQDPEVTGRLAKLGLDPAPLGREDFVRFLEGEMKSWGEIVKNTKAKAE